MSRFRKLKKWEEKLLIPIDNFMMECQFLKKDLIGDEGKGFHYILHGLNPKNFNCCRSHWESAEPHLETRRRLRERPCSI